MADEQPAEVGGVHGEIQPEVPGQPGIVETPDGTQHVGALPTNAAQPDTRTSVPGEPAGKRTKGWYRSRGGVLSHADGPSQVAAYVSLGYTEVDDATAQKEIGDGITLEVDRAGSAGTFDAESVQRAVVDEGSTATSSKRSAAARKGAETKRRKAAEKAAAEGSTDT